MTERDPIPLVGLIVTDRFSGEILLLHRRDHVQWQLPGGRIEEQDGLFPDVPASADVVASSAAIRHAREELGYEVDEERLHFLGSAPFKQWGKEYDCRYVELRVSIDLAELSDPETYDGIKKLSPFRLNEIRQPEYSANLVNFAGKLASGEIELVF
jgi:8-oxo-dGTP pyrophosphatase MutT (NUDIX family)